MNAKQFAVGEVVYRHGDVLLFKSEPVKSKARAVTQGLLHKGENHHHFLRKGKFVLIEGEKGKFLNVLKPTELTHEEHKTLKLEPGAYRMEIQQEYDHFLEESRNVID